MTFKEIRKVQMVRRMTFTIKIIVYTSPSQQLSQLLKMLSHKITVRLKTYWPAQTHLYSDF